MLAVSFFAANFSLGALRVALAIKGSMRISFWYNLRDRRNWTYYEYRRLIYDSMYYNHQPRLHLNAVSLTSQVSSSDQYDDYVMTFRIIRTSNISLYPRHIELQNASWLLIPEENGFNSSRRLIKSVESPKKFTPGRGHLDLLMHNSHLSRTSQNHHDCIVRRMKLTRGLEPRSSRLTMKAADANPYTTWEYLEQPILFNWLLFYIFTNIQKSLEVSETVKPLQSALFHFLTTFELTCKSSDDVSIQNSFPIMLSRQIRSCHWIKLSQSCLRLASHRPPVSLAFLVVSLSG